MCREEVFWNDAKTVRMYAEFQTSKGEKLDMRTDSILIQLVRYRLLII